MNKTIFVVIAIMLLLLSGAVFIANKDKILPQQFNLTESSGNKIIRSATNPALTFQAINVTGQTYPDLRIMNGANMVVNLKLVDNTEQCLTDCYAIINITNTISGALPNSFDFRDRKNNLDNLSYKIYFLNITSKNVTLPHYANQTCNTVNGMPNCSIARNDFNTTVTNSFSKWQLYTGQTFSPGNWTLKIEGKKGINDAVDWGFGYQGFLSDDIRTYWAWWNAGWTKMKPITLSLADAIPRSNTTAYINVTWVSGMRNDFGDLRFINLNNDTQLNYWFYNNSYISGNSVLVLVRMNDSLSASQNRTIYMYYGNAGATTTSSITDVALFSDDFTSALDWTNRWYSANQGNYILSGDGKLNLTFVDGTTQQLMTQTNFTGASLEWRGQTSGTPGSKLNHIYNFINNARTWDTSKQNIRTDNIGTTPGYNGSVNIGGASQTLGCNYTSGKFWIYDTEMNLSGNNRIGMFGDGRISQCGSLLSSAQSLNAGYFGWLPYKDTVSDATGQIDWVLVKQYTDGDISSTFGAEQSNGGGGGPVNATLVDWISQTPADITATNLQNQSVSIIYNITTNAGLINVATVNLYWLTNATSRTNYSQLVNGSIVNPGFTSSGVTFTNISSLFNFTLSDDSVYPSNSLLPILTFENSPHLNFTMNNDNIAIKALVLNMTNNTQYNILQFTVQNITQSAQSLRIYYCNSTYTVGTFTTNANCGQIADVPVLQGFNQVENQSKYFMASLAMNTTDATLGGVKVTPSGYFIFRGRTAGGWTAQYISTVARPGGTNTSTDLGATYSNLNGELDYHLHQMNADSLFNYYACANSTSIPSNYNCSTVRFDTLNQSDLPPSSPSVYAPTTGTYTGIININYTAAISPNGYAITKYNISLMNSDDTFNLSIKANNGQNLSFAWNSSAIVTGTFNIHVQVFDQNNLTSFGESELFSISNTLNATTTVTTNPATPIAYTTASNISCFNDKGLATQMYIDGVNQTSQKGIFIVRGAKTYSINCSSDAQLGYFASSQVVSYQVQKDGVIPTVIASPSNNNNYGTQTTVTGSDCPSELTCTLNKDGVPVSNPDIQTLNVGTYLYNYSTSGNENYSAGSASLTMTILKINPSLTLSIMPGTTVINGTQTTATGAGCPDGSCLLKRDGSVVSNPEVTTLPLGIYLYNYSFAGSTNYNPFSVSQSLNVNPTAFAGSSGSINFTAGNLTQTLTFQVPFHLVTHAFMNLSSPSITCYQESANQSNQDNNDGSCGLNYSGNYATANNYLYINYSKPSSGTNSATWKVRLGWLATQYVNIPQSCFNYNSNVVQLREYSFRDADHVSNGTSYGQCFNGVWNNITSVSFNRTAGGGYIANDTSRMYDGNWKTYDYFQIGSGLNVWKYSDPDSTCADTEICNGPTYTDKLWEEAIIWNINPSNPNVTIGNNILWTYSGIFNQLNNQTNNFFTQMNTYLSGCTFTGSFCSVPITFSSATPGILNYSDFYVDNAGFIENSQTYNATVFATTTSTFEINISYSSDLTANAIFNYNGVNYSSVTSTGSGTNKAFSINIPTNTVGSIPFYWVIQLTDNSGNQQFVNSAQHSQTVNAFYLSICNATSNVPYLNFTIADENNLLPMNGSLQASFSYGLGTTGSLNYSFGNSNDNQTYYAFCLNPSYLSIVLNGIVTYSKAGYDLRTYNFINANVNNATQRITLYLLNTSSSDLFTFTIVDTAGNGIPNAYIYVQRWDVSTGNFNTVGTLKTDNQGHATINLRLNDAYYRYQIIYNGVLVKTEGPYIETTSGRTITLDIGAANIYQHFLDIYGLVTYNNNTNTLVYNFADTTGAAQQFCLRVTKTSIIGGSVVSNNCLTASSGVLEYTISNGTYIGDGLVSLTSQFNNANYILSTTSASMGVSVAKSTFGDSGLIITIIMWITAAAIGAAANSLPLGFGLMIGVFIFSTLIGWLVISGTTIIVSVGILMVMIGAIAYRRFF